MQVRVPRLERNRITTSYATLPDAHHALVRVYAEGLVGIGEAPAEIWWTGEDAVSVCNAISRYLAPALQGRRVAPHDAVKLMDRALAANFYAKAAIEMAIWDLAGKASGMPLYHLIGAAAPLPVPVKYVIGIRDKHSAREEVAWALDAGFRYLKVKVGGELADDLTRVEAVMKAAPGIPVGVDANEGWDVTTARHAAHELDAMGIAFIEQPVQRAEEGALASLTATTRAPIVLHESLFTVQDAARCARDRLGRIWAVTPPAHEGLVNTLQILELARGNGIPCLIGSTVELGVASAFMAHIAASDSNVAQCPVPSDIIGSLYHEDDIVTEQVRLKDGFVYAPQRPGLGVELDGDALRRFQVQSGP